jgi:predicted phosphodiesterase
MLKGAFGRNGLGGVREHLAYDTSGSFGGKLYFITSDQHVPYQDENAHRAIAELAQVLRPQGWVFNGDFLDLLEISRHSAGSLAKLEGRRICTTFNEGNRILDLLITAAGKQCTDLHFIDGNHEDRINRWLSTADNGIFSGDESISIARRLKFDSRGIQYHEGYPEAGVRLGKLWVTHGRFTNKYHANKMLDYYRHSVLYGHTHAPQMDHAPALRGQQVAIGTGHLGDPDSPAMSYAPRPNRWVSGFALVYVYPDGSFNAQPINLWRGQFVYAGITYGKRSAR